eukprot:3500139-Pyramimonas_sp.AAC.1
MSRLLDLQLHHPPQLPRAIHFLSRSPILDETAGCIIYLGVWLLAGRLACEIRISADHDQDTGGVGEGVVEAVSERGHDTCLLASTQAM